MMRCRTVLVLVSLISFLGGCGHVPDKKCSPIDTIKSYKDIPGVTAEEISAIETLKTQRDKISYGTLLSTESFQLPDGTLGGFSVEFCNLLTELFGIPFVTELYEWDDLLHKLESREIDFTGELTPTEERIHHKGYLMSMPIAQRQLRVFVLSNSNRIQAEKDFEGLTVAFLEGTTLAGEIRNLYSVRFNNVEVADYATAASMLQSGAIDAFIDEAVADPAFDEYDFVCSQIIFPLVHSPVSMTTGNPDLAPIISVVDKYIAHFAAQGKIVLFELYQAGDFACARSKLEKLLSDEEKAYIQDMKNRNASVRVAVEQDGYPTNFYNEGAKEYQGIALDVLKEISKLLDIRFEIISGKDLTWADIYDKVQAGEIPMMGQLLKSEPRKEHFIWSAAPYARSYFAVMSKSDFPNLVSFQVPCHSIGALRKSVFLGLYQTLFPKTGNIREYDSLYECLDALDRGEVELLMASEYMLITQTHYREKTGFKVNLRLPVPMDSHFGFNKDETVLCSIISKAQQFVPVEEIASHWINRSFDYSRKAAEDRLFLMAVFSAVVSLVLAISVFLLVRTVKLEKRLEEIASKDALTDIFNRRYFMELAAIQMDRVFRTNSQCFVVIYDLDHFKVVNDTYGHLAGDKVLKEIAQRVKAAIRPYDLFGRYGGEEFILLMSDVSEGNVIEVVERIRLIVCSNPVEFENIRIPVSASFGVAKVLPGTDMNTVTKYADEALYRAKEKGRNRVVFSRGAEADEKPLLLYLQSKIEERVEKN